MTPEEHKLLSDLAERVSKIPAPVRDPEAEDFIRTRIGSRPDALYLMTQTVVVQGIAIEHAQQEIDQLKRQLSQQQAQPQAPASGGTGFLPSRGSGWQTPPAPQQPPPYAPGPGPQYAYPPAPGFGPPQPPPSGPFGGISSGGMGGFLKTAGYTAAGVAAGALAFEGVKSMFGGVEHLMGFGNHEQRGGFLNDEPVRETVVNNYYDSPPDRDYQDRDVASNLGPDPSVDYSDTDVSPADDDSSFDDNSSGSDDLV